MSHAEPTTKPLDSTPSPVRYLGGCHCGAVRFAVELESGFSASRCNCTICAKIAQTGAIVKPSAFELLAGKEKESVAGYQWGAKISTRFFCKQCGVHCYGSGHLEELGGDFVSVNLNCLDLVDVNDLSVVYWDGRHDNWTAGPRPAPWPIFTKTN